MKTPDFWVATCGDMVVAEEGRYSHKPFAELVKKIQDDALAEQRKLSAAICDKWRDKLDAATANSIKAEIVGNV